MDRTDHVCQDGFTLIELCVAMTLLIIVGFIAVPRLTSLQSRWQAQGAAQSAITTLNAARIQAMKLNATVSVCPSTDEAQCTLFDATGRYWLIVDERSNAILRSVRIPDGFSLRGSATRPRVRFQPNGWSSGTNMTLKLCDASNVRRKDIIISNAGRIRSLPYEDGELC